MNHARQLFKDVLLEISELVFQLLNALLQVTNLSDEWVTLGHGEVRSR